MSKVCMYTYNIWGGGGGLGEKERSQSYYTGYADKQETLMYDALVILEQWYCIGWIQFCYRRSLTKM